MDAEVVPLLAHVAGGAASGVVIAFVIGCSLLEISTNTTFSLVLPRPTPKLLSALVPDVRRLPPSPRCDHRVASSIPRRATTGQR